VRYCNCSKAQCKGRSEPIAKNSSDAPQPRRRDPLTVSERARRLVWLRTVLSAPMFQARLCAGEQGERP
jgi:hypothetical protein